VRLVNDMFARAIEMCASDIHVEPAENALIVRFRVDGILQEVMTPAANMFAAIASRLKLIGGLNIAESRLPQDGRTDLQIGRAQIDVRISTLPSLHGESIVLRILRKDIGSFNLGNIGMGPKLRDDFTNMVQIPHGMILVVGPTGSGKTTTLYCVMNIINSKEKKVITIEDPIEYQIPGVTQIQVKPAIGMSFANGLRSIVRQDPDIILVGEIRDKETAEIAIHAALTGHLVLSTLHTNDATGAISRLIDMGVEPFLISSALVGVMSQRLVRRVCSSCGGEGSAENLNWQAGADATTRCRTCGGTGFRGRVGIYEFLTISDTIRKAVAADADNATLSSIAREEGMSTLREDGEKKAAEGITTMAEVTRVCQLDIG
jgi:type II secretory ATPase GspE/PulE/Tfp pilus assembly ATPase PilB-like protein